MTPHPGYDAPDGAASAGSEGSGAFQARVRPWMLECFGPVIPFDKVERGDRLLEEVFELLQSGGYDPARVLALRDYVWGRDVGEPAQEAGGVMVTMAAYCIAFGLDMHEAGETELARIWTKVEAIRAKQAAKPTGSALPIGGSPDIAQSSRLEDQSLTPLEKELVEALRPFADVPFGRESLGDEAEIEIRRTPEPLEYSVGQNVKRARLLMREFRKASDALSKAEPRPDSKALPVGKGER